MTQLIERLTDDIREGQLVLPNLQPVSAEALRALIEANVQRFLTLFTRAGILLGA